MIAGSRRGVVLGMVFGLALVIASTMLGVSGARAIITPPTGSEKGHADDHGVLDTRIDDEALEVLDEQLGAAQKLSESSGARVSFDDSFGTPRQIFNEEGYLTGTASGTATEVARKFISDNIELFGLTGDQVSPNALVATEHELPGPDQGEDVTQGTTVVSFQQTFGDEIESAFGGRMNVAVKDDGRVVSYTGNPIRKQALLNEFAISEADALSVVAEDLAPDVNFVAEALTEPIGRATEIIGEEAGWTAFERGGLPSNHFVKQAIFPTAAGPRAAFRVLFVNDLDDASEVVVDAGSGEILFERSLVQHQASPEAEGSIYKNYPGAPGGGGQQEVVSFEGDPKASPCGWLNLNPGCEALDANAPIVTNGNNANTHSNWDSFIAPNEAAGVRGSDIDNNPVNGAQFNAPYENNWGDTDGAEGSYIEDINPAATSLFYHHNKIHDDYYKLGFTETAGNFQVNNYEGDPTKGTDPLEGLVQAGAASGGEEGMYTGRNNAYMLTMPDGLKSWSGMFLWEPIPAAFESPYVDGDFDAGVIWHEYTHGLTNRYVAGGESLNSFQSGSMGEGWSDWYALDYLYSQAGQTTSEVGAYVTGNPERGIRNWPFDENPTNYGDVGYDIVGPEVHSDGEIWTVALWDLRKALIEKNPKNGAQIARRLITDAQPLTAPDPSFLDARDGILAANRARYDGEHRDVIWSTFADRGMGNSATTEGGDDTDPEPAFDHPNNNMNGNLIGKVVNDSTGKPVKNARVLFGEFEARATPIARTGQGGGFGEKVVGGTYDLTIQAPGFGSRTYKDIRVSAGSSRKIQASLTPNLVSARNGARIVSSSASDPDNPVKNLVDDSEATVWSTEENANGFDQAQATVRLREISTVRAVRLSAFKNISDSRFAAMKDWKFQTSMDGKKWKLGKRGTFQTDDPRPVTPELQLRRFVMDNPVKARFVKFTINSTQDDSVGYAQAAELQVYSQTSEGIKPMKVTSDRPFTDSGTIDAGNSSIMDPNFGVTGSEFTTSCQAPPQAQGTDGWVSTLPDSFGDGNHTVSVNGAAPNDHDIDLFFFNSACELVGSQATPSANESAVLPGGSKYVLTALYSGTNEQFNLKAQTAP